MFDQIDKYVARCIHLNEAESEFFHSVLQPKNLKKKTFLLHENEVCQFETYIIKGCIRTFYVNENGFEVNLQFAIEDWWVGDVASFSEGKPSRMFIQTMEDCEVLMIGREQKEALFQRVPKFERLFRLIIQRNLAALQNRFFSTVSQPAEVRYLEFLEKYPTIPQRIPQHYIASFLGISPEFLSKIRAKLNRKK